MKRMIKIIPITQKESVAIRKALPKVYIPPRTTHKKYFVEESREVLRFLKEYRASLSYKE